MDLYNVQGLAYIFQERPGLVSAHSIRKPPDVKYGYMLSLKYDIPFDIGEKAEKKKARRSAPSAIKAGTLASMQIYRENM